MERFSPTPPPVGRDAEHLECDQCSDGVREVEDDVEPTGFDHAVDHFRRVRRQCRTNAFDRDGSEPRIQESAVAVPLRGVGLVRNQVQAARRNRDTPVRTAVGVPRLVRREGLVITTDAHHVFVACHDPEAVVVVAVRDRRLPSQAAGELDPRTRVFGEWWSKSRWSSNAVTSWDRRSRRCHMAAGDRLGFW